MRHLPPALTIAPAATNSIFPKVRHSTRGRELHYGIFEPTSAQAWPKKSAQEEVGYYSAAAFPRCVNERFHGVFADCERTDAEGGRHPRCPCCGCCDVLKLKGTKYERLEAHGLYWTASANDPRTARFYNFGKGGQAVNRHLQGDKQMAVSVRCIRD
jgi:hypothetical protein